MQSLAIVANAQHHANSQPRFQRPGAAKRKSLSTVLHPAHEPGEPPEKMWSPLNPKKMVMLLLMMIMKMWPRRHLISPG
jgi:hypothetical protein